MLFVAALCLVMAAANAKVYMVSNFDLEIGPKSPEEGKYHEFMQPLMQAMVNDKNLVSLRALHPLLNANENSRANGILFEFETMTDFLEFQKTYNLHFLSLSTWWKNWRSTLWEGAPVHTGDTGALYKQRETGEGKYFYLLTFNFAVKDSAASGYQSEWARTWNNLNTLKSSTPSWIATTLLQDNGHHSDYTHRLFFEFDSFDGINAFYANSAVQTWIRSATSSHWSRWATDVIIAPAPVDATAAQAARAQAQAQQQKQG